MEKLQRQNIFSEWLFWNFYEVPKFLIEAWKNYILFALNYFSLRQLLRSLFYPWKKYRWKYPKIFNVVEFFNTLVSNIFSRIIGVAMRIVLIFMGIIFQIFVVLAGAIVFLSWILLPFILIAAFLFVLIN